MTEGAFSRFYCSSLYLAKTGEKVYCALKWAHHLSKPKLARNNLMSDRSESVGFGTASALKGPVAIPALHDRQEFADQVTDIDFLCLADLPAAPRPSTDWPGLRRAPRPS